MIACIMLGGERGSCKDEPVCIKTSSEAAVLQAVVDDLQEKNACK